MSERDDTMTAAELLADVRRRQAEGHAHAAKVARQASLARGQWTPSGAGLEVRLA